MALSLWQQGRTVTHQLNAPHGGTGAALVKEQAEIARAGVTPAQRQHCVAELVRVLAVARE
jgi:hypothetical protein